MDDVTMYSVVGVVIFSMALTWGIGLIIPLLVRFLLLKRPIKKIWAIVFSVLLTLVNFIVFLAIGFAIHGEITKQNNMFSLVLISFVAYYIFTKKKKE